MAVGSPGAPRLRLAPWTPTDACLARLTVLVDERPELRDFRRVLAA
jgi:hypothetical protein